MEELRSDEIRSAVRENYGKVAQLTIVGGCGNPQAIADLKIGETLLDLGSAGCWGHGAGDWCGYDAGNGQQRPMECGKDRF